MIWAVPACACPIPPDVKLMQEGKHVSQGLVHAHKALGGGKGGCCRLSAGDKAAPWVQELGCGREGRAGP